MFSELVDICIERSRRLDKKADIISYVNQTIRDMQSRQMLYKNLHEDTITATANPMIWTPPVRFQRLRAVRYQSNRDRPKLKQPGLIQKDASSYYYRSTTYFVFVGHADNDLIDLAYYRVVPKLAYFAEGAREAVYDFTTETWSYPLQEANIAQMQAEGLPASEIATQQAADLLLQPGLEAAVSNWLLFDWFELVQEGTLAKLWKELDDEKRAATHFSFFERQFTQNFLPQEVQQSEITE